MKRVVITGPTGAIGNALIRKLLEENVEIIAICHRNSKRKHTIPKNDKVHVIDLNLNELMELPKLVQQKVDVFYHLGWDGTFGNSRNNMQGQLLNIQYSLDAVEAASKLGCKKFVGAGSQAEYGRFEGRLNALTPTFPENGYGIAKLCAGQMTRILCEQKDMEHIWVRILSVYGPYDGDNTMVMSTISKLLKGEHPSFTKGEQMWDYLYSEDAASALYLIGIKGIHGKVYCLGSGQARPLHEYIEEIRNTIGSKQGLGFGEVPYAPNQVMFLCADISELTEDTGFIPKYEFVNGIRETIQYCMKNRE